MIRRPFRGSTHLSHSSYLTRNNPCGCRGQGKHERALVAANGADPCTLLSPYRLARGIFFLPVGVLSAGRHNLSVYH